MLGQPINLQECFADSDRTQPGEHAQMTRQSGSSRMESSIAVDKGYIWLEIYYGKRAQEEEEEEEEKEKKIENISVWNIASKKTKGFR